MGSLRIGRFISSVLIALLAAGPLLAAQKKSASEQNALDAQKIALDAQLAYERGDLVNAALSCAKLGGLRFGSPTCEQVQKLTERFETVRTRIKERKLVEALQLLDELTDYAADKQFQEVAFLLSSATGIPVAVQLAEDKQRKLEDRIYNQTEKDLAVTGACDQAALNTLFSSIDKDRSEVLNSWTLAISELRIKERTDDLKRLATLFGKRVKDADNVTRKLRDVDRRFAEGETDQEARTASIALKSALTGELADLNSLLEALEKEMQSIEDGKSAQLGEGQTPTDELQRKKTLDSVYGRVLRTMRTAKESTCTKPAK